MDVANALTKRHAVRAFRSEPIPRHVIADILESARWTPSGGNLQPWHVDILSGRALSHLVEEIQQRFDECPDGEERDHHFYPSELPAVYRTRRRTVGHRLYDLIGVVRDDEVGKRDQVRRNLAFFGAPVGLIFTTMRNAEPLQFVDIGMFLQSILLRVEEHGLGACPQGIFSMYPRTIARILELPAKRMVVCGMALGYADENAAINQRFSERAPLEEFAVFREEM